jgi:orotate phosphoribosyltransferase-like protein
MNSFRELIRFVRFLQRYGWSKKEIMNHLRLEREFNQWLREREYTKKTGGEP